MFAFHFSFVEKEAIFKEIKLLKSNKSTQHTNIPTKLIKGKAILLWILFL